MTEWKNEALRRALYEQAVKEGGFDDAYWYKPLTRRERWRWRLGDYARRVRRAAAILAGRDEEDD